MDIIFITTLSRLFSEKIAWLNDTCERLEYNIILGPEYQIIFVTAGKNMYSIALLPTC